MSWQSSTASPRNWATKQVTEEPKEIAQSAAPQLEVNVYKNYIPLCAVLIGIVGNDIYMPRGHSMGEQSERKPEMKPQQIKMYTPLICNIFNFKNMFSCIKSNGNYRWKTNCENVSSCWSWNPSYCWIFRTGKKLLRIRPAPKVDFNMGDIVMLSIVGHIWYVDWTRRNSCRYY